MKILTTFILVFILQFNYHGNCSPKYVKNNCFEGYIFEKDCDNKGVLNNEYLLFTPSEDEVIQAEKLLVNKIKDLNTKRYNQGKRCPVIHRNMKKYYRQYIGYINEDDEKIIWINFIWKNQSPKNWNKEIIIVDDGCSFYWQVKVNLNSKNLFDLFVNGNS